MGEPVTHEHRTQQADGGDQRRGAVVVKIGTADYDCERKEITPVEAVVRPQYEQTFRKQDRKLLVQVRPVGG